jgi:hypothetical protein
LDNYWLGVQFRDVFEFRDQIRHELIVIHFREAGDNTVQRRDDVFEVLQLLTDLQKLINQLKRDEESYRSHIHCVTIPHSLYNDRTSSEYRSHIQCITIAHPVHSDRRSTA